MQTGASRVDVLSEFFSPFLPFPDFAGYFRNAFPLSHIWPIHSGIGLYKHNTPAHFYPMGAVEKGGASSDHHHHHLLHPSSIFHVSHTGHSGERSKSPSAPKSILKAIHMRKHLGFHGTRLIMGKIISLTNGAIHSIWITYYAIPTQGMSGSLMTSSIGRKASSAFGLHPKESKVKDPKEPPKGRASHLANPKPKKWPYAIFFLPPSNIPTAPQIMALEITNHPWSDPLYLRPFPANFENYLCPH